MAPAFLGLWRYKMEFNIDARRGVVYIKISFENFNDLKWLKENLWLELMKRWSEFTGLRRRTDGDINS